MACFTLIRRADGTRYRFFRSAQSPHRFWREDRPDLAITWESAKGWVMRDPTSLDVTGQAWEPACSGPDRLPPEGRWVTAQGIKSYIYDLTYPARPGGLT